jgi:hypothetical protein
VWSKGLERVSARRAWMALYFCHELGHKEVWTVALMAVQCSIGIRPHGLHGIPARYVRTSPKPPLLTDLAESPRILLKRGQVERARSALTIIYNTATLGHIQGKPRPLHRSVKQTAQRRGRWRRCNSETASSRYGEWAGTCGH